MVLAHSMSWCLFPCSLSAKFTDLPAHRWVPTRWIPCRSRSSGGQISSCWWLQSHLPWKCGDIWWIWEDHDHGWDLRIGYQLRCLGLAIVLFRHNHHEQEFVLNNNLFPVAPFPKQFYISSDQNSKITDLPRLSLRRFPLKTSNFLAWHGSLSRSGGWGAAIPTTQTHRTTSCMPCDSFLIC